MKKLIDYLPKTKALMEELKQPSRKEQIVNAIREVYSIDDELAILRQRDSKPEEFKEYFDFVEKIKSEVKEWEDKCFI